MTLAQLEQHARAVGDAVNKCTPLGVGFAVLMFDFGGGGNMTYVSNAQRADMVRALRECANTIEMGLDAPPTDPFTGRSPN